MSDWRRPRAGIPINNQPSANSDDFVMFEEIQQNRIVMNFQRFRVAPNQPLIEELLRIANEVSNAIAARMDTLTNHYMMGIVLIDDRNAMVDRPFGIGGRRRWMSGNEIRENFPQSLLQAIQNLSQSERNLIVQNIEVEAVFHPTAGIARGKSQPFYVRKVIGSEGPTKGLFVYDTTGNNCGFRAMVVALATDPDLRNAYPFEFDESLDVRSLRSKTRLNNQAELIRKQMKIASPEWNIYKKVNHNGQIIPSTAELIVRLVPKIQIVIFNEVTRTVIDHQRGKDFSYENPLTIFMSYAMEHLQLIKSLYTYFGRFHNSFVYYCHMCLKFYTGDHSCNDLTTHKCDKCTMVFDECAQLKAHKEIQQGIQPFCNQCGETFYNNRCLTMHFCREKKIKYCENCRERIHNNGHVCHHYLCFHCREFVSPGHRCQLKTVGKLTKKSAEQEGKNYFAFDVESMLDDDGKGVKNHKVNLLVVRRCFSEEEHIFNGFRDFMFWLESIKYPCTFFAHNLKGYDGRLLYEYLVECKKFPQDVLFSGTKIMRMKYGRYEFRDTLTHFNTSLSRLPDMFGLDKTKFKKGWFPYLFNTTANQTYVGQIPDKAYYDPDFMSPDQLSEFNQWYDQQDQNVEWSLAKELEEYCVSDVRILAQAIECYMTTMMERIQYNPFSNLTNAGYARSVYGLVFAPANQLYVLEREEYENIRKAMHGGRTDCRRLMKEWSSEEIQQGYYGVYQDVQSLYPAVQYYDPMPVGVPNFKSWSVFSQPTMSQLLEVFGFVCCDIDPPKKPLYHPVLVDVNEEGRLVADLLPKKMYVVATPELKVAIQHGYTVLRVHWWYHFEKSFDLFKEYISTFIKDKIEASGMPKWIKSDEDWEVFAHELKTRVGVKIERGKMKKNAGKKSGAKILLNSLWGKFGERPHTFGYRVFEVGKANDELISLEKDWADEKIDITYRRYNGSRTHLVIGYKSASEDQISKFQWKNHLSRTNIAIAAMVTAHARMRLWTEMNKLGKRVLYHDTDSIIYEHSPTEYNIPSGKYLGEWEDETGGLPIVKFVSTGPKCYTYVIKENEETFVEHTKVKGITLTSYNTDLINYNAMCELVKDEMKSIEAKTLIFSYNRNAGTMTTETKPKIFKRTCNKGVIDPESWMVYPFGWFHHEETDLDHTQ